MAFTESLNEAARNAVPPLFLADGFSAGVGRELVAAGHLPGSVRRWRDGGSAAPTRRLRVAMVPSGTVGRREALAALASPDASPLPIFELLPPPSNRLMAIISRVALGFTAALFVYGLAMAFAVPMTLKATSLWYGGGFSGALEKVVRDVQIEDGMMTMKENDREKAKRFFDRVKELKAERGIVE